MITKMQRRIIFGQDSTYLPLASPDERSTLSEIGVGRNWSSDLAARAVYVAQNFFARSWRVGTFTRSGRRNSSRDFLVAAIEISKKGHGICNQDEIRESLLRYSSACFLSAGRGCEAV